jgi:uncharacterized protein (TIGR00304 family)
MRWIAIGSILVFIGILAIMAGVLQSAYQHRDEIETKGAGIVMIGPIPIVFGTDVSSLKMVMILAIVLTVMAFVLLFLLSRYAGIQA